MTTELNFRDLKTDNQEENNCEVVGNLLTDDDDVMANESSNGEKLKPWGNEELGFGISIDARA